MSAAAFSACYADWKLIKTRACVQIVLEIPIERANEAYTVLGGMPVAGAEVWCGVARLDPHKVGVATPSEGGKDRASSPHDPPPSHRLTTRAVMLSKDPQFHKFLEGHLRLGNVTEEEAATYIRDKCRVASRSEIKPGTEAATRLDFIESAYICWKEKDRYVAA